MINQSRIGEPRVLLGPYSVRQEVNTSEANEIWDIADIVLESDTTVIVIENYESSDGHGHGYERYLRFGQRGEKTGVVVLLCATEDRALLVSGWQNAAVVTYESFLDYLGARLDRDPNYAKDNEEQRSFIGQLHRKYVRGKNRMSDRDVLDFVAAMCSTGEAKRYQEQNQDVAAERFASDLAQQARESFGEGREVLQRVKARLRSYGTNVLTAQLNAAVGAGFVEKVSARFSGIYQWTVNFETGETHDSFDEARLQIKFGPSRLARERARQELDAHGVTSCRRLLTSVPHACEEPRGAPVGDLPQRGTRRARGRRHAPPGRDDRV